MKKRHIGIVTIIILIIFLATSLLSYDLLVNLSPESKNTKACTNTLDRLIEGADPTNYDIDTVRNKCTDEIVLKHVQTIGVVNEN